MSEENVEAVLSALDGWNRGDLDAWLGSAHPDIEFRTSGIYPGTQPIYRGHAELRRFWTTFREPWESLQIHVEQAREVGDDVVVLGTFEAHARDGMSVQREVAWIFRFVGDLNLRADAYGTWKAALEAVGLEESAMSRENVEIVHRLIDAWNRRDLDAFLALMDPDVEFTARFMEMEGDPYYRGHDGVRDWWRAVLATFPDFTLEVLAVRDLGDSVIAPLRARGHGLDSGVPFEETLWSVGESRDGKVTWWRNFGSETEALEAAGLRE